MREMGDKLFEEVLSARVDLLQSVALFANVNKSVLTHMAKDFRERTYRKGENIFYQEDESRQFYIIVEGKVRVYHLSSGGDETTVNIFAAGEVLGEFALVDDLPRTATVQAITDCTLLEMPSAQGIDYLTNVPGLALAMCRQIARKVRWTTMYAETISRLDAPARLLHFLLYYNEQFGVELTSGVRYEVDLGLNQEDLATLIGVRRTWMATLLGKWKKRELIRYERGGKITILDMPRVKAQLNNQPDCQKTRLPQTRVHKVA